MSYVDDARTALTEELAARGSECPARLLDLYTLLVLMCGTHVDLEDVHDAWSVWTALDRPGHRSLIPFDDLVDDVQQLDAPFRDAIRAAAERVNPPTPAALPGRVFVRMQVGDTPPAHIGELLFDAGETGDDIARRMPEFLRAAADQYETATSG